MRYMLDTDIFTLAYHDRAGLRARIERVRPPDAVCISTVLRVEVLIGRFDAVRKAATGRDVLLQQMNIERSEEYLARYTLVRFDEAASAFFEAFRTGRKPLKIGRADLLIACIALAHNATLVTRNVKDFAAVPQLTLENWAD